MRRGAPSIAGGVTMNLRWLFGNFTDPQYNLPRKEQFRLSNLAHERHVTWRSFLWRSALILAPLLIALKLLNPFLTQFGFGNSSLAHIIVMGAFIVLFWPWSAWMFRSLYVVPIRKVMREAGYDLCLGCGYELRGLPPPAEMSRCPECGAEREAEGESAANVDEDVESEPAA
jgi:hypothetical protein